MSGPVDGASDSSVPGTVAVVGDCIGVKIGDNSYVVVWPTGTTAGEGGDPGIVLPDGVEVALGSEIEGGGGFTAPADLPATAPELPGSCSDAEQIAVLDTVNVP